MRNIETRLAKLEDQFSDRHRVALDWLLCFLRTMQGDDADSRERLQWYADSPVTRANNERMHNLARRVLAGSLEPEPDSTADACFYGQDSRSESEPGIPNDLDLSE